MCNGDLNQTALEFDDVKQTTVLSVGCLSESKVSNILMKSVLKEVSFAELVWCNARTKFTIFSIEREVIGKTAVFN